VPIWGELNQVCEFARRARALWRFFPIFETPQPFSLASERNL
jgi:hypothetical protein